MTWQDTFKQWNKEDRARITEYKLRAEYILPIMGQKDFDTYIQHLERYISDRELDLALFDLAKEQV